MASERSLLAIIRASRPSFRTAHDGVAFAVHASFLAAGFSLIATGGKAVSDEPPLDGEEVCMEGWNDLDGLYGFVYVRQENAHKRTVLLKCLVIGEILVVDSVDLRGEQEPRHLELKVKDFISDDVDGRRNYAEIYTNLEVLAKRLDVGLLAEEKSGIGSPMPTRGNEVSGDTANSEPAVGVPVSNQPNTCLLYPPVPSSGSSDLYPGPGGGFYPFRGSGGSGDMLVGPNDPRWFGTDVQPALPGRIPGEVPGLPPGARFDPFGPPGVPGFEPRRFIRDPNRPGGDVHPDLQHFRSDYI